MYSNNQNYQYKMPQLSGVFFDRDCNHLFKAFPGGWDKKRWAGIMRKALTGTMVQVQPCQWIVCEVQPWERKAFAKHIERAFRQVKVPARHFTVRAKSDSGHATYVFVAGLSEEILERYCIETISETEQLKDWLNDLLDHKNHPNVRGLRRIDFSETLGHELRLIRMKDLITMAVSGKDHELYRLPTRTEPWRRMIAFLKVDQPLIANVSIKQQVALLHETGLLSDTEIALIEKELLRPYPWQLQHVYRGTPEDGARCDEEDGRFIVRRLNDFATKSIHKEPLDAAALAWELIPSPEHTGGGDDLL